MFKQIAFSLDLAQIDESLIKTVTKKDGSIGKYVNLIGWPNRDGKDHYGNDGVIKHSLSKEQRDSGVEAKQILANFRVQEPDNYSLTKDYHEKTSIPNSSNHADNDDDIPF